MCIAWVFALRNEVRRCPSGEFPPALRSSWDSSFQDWVGFRLFAAVGRLAGGRGDFPMM